MPSPPAFPRPRPYSGKVGKRPGRHPLIGLLVFGGWYPYPAVGKLAAPIFATAGAAGGAVAARMIPGAPPAVANAMIWAAIAGFIAFVVFASEGPRERPGGVVQSATADGVVSGIIAAVSGAVLDLVASTGAGASSGKQVGFLGFVAMAMAAGGGGMLVGGGAGALLVPLGGRERLSREPVRRRQKRSRRRRRGRR